ncbi:CGNR zinc finger domain-containing protein [Jiangella mangrovi]|uniref:Putative RNA-binding Zn ribbon-like protein n=1 Tax=Jiangella mangrovi TaxID=1524084 RepID=A0A7W9GQ41_9ACTN|nr:ABATE domain-containing protein [Jiangella mangrovi]MBB5787763.1 putative RNA-binding Zn ribbon-like protein [Jiangella mangrovi]
MTDVELVGNALCLDFANTVNARPVATRDWLATPEQALTWARAVGHPVDGDPSLDYTLPAARDLRETVYRTFRPLAHGERPATDDVEDLHAVHAEGVAHARFIDDGAGFRLSWAAPQTMRVLLWEVAASAVALLSAGPLDRLGECPSCRWVFLDTSKNGRRRWCSMATCGSRDKARRYYEAHTTP